MHRTTTFTKVQKTLQNYNLQWDQLQCVTVDGGKNMTGVRKGLMEQIRSQLEDLQILNALFIYCIIHQEVPCWKDLDIP